MVTTLSFAAAAAVGVWGVAHVIPTRQVLRGFDPITTDNRRIILQEWVAEAFAMWGLSAVLIVTNVVGGSNTESSVWIYRTVAALLVALAVLTASTGARTPVVWFKICPVLLTASALLLVSASLL